jgi:hypothetical protein
MLQGEMMLLMAFGSLAVIWILILGFSKAFGSPPEH